jgi:hypothetical protein
MGGVSLPQHPLADIVIISLHSERNISLFESLQGKVSGIYSIGDCSESEVVDI